MESSSNTVTDSSGEYKGVVNDTKKRLTHLNPGHYRSTDNIEIILLSYNRLTNLADTVFDEITHLQCLQLNHNRLTQVDKAISKLEHLKSLDLSFNEIREITSSCFEQNTRLVRLRLTGNQLKYVSNTSFAKLTALEHLELSATNIGLLNPPIFDKNVLLRELVLEKAHLQIGPNLFDKLINLQSLDICSNNIRKLDVNTFKGLLNLQYLYLGKNQIKGLKKDLLKHNVQLVFLDLQDNNIETIDPDFFKPLPYLTSIILRGCNPKLQFHPHHFDNQSLINCISFSYCETFPVFQMKKLISLSYDSRNIKKCRKKDRDIPPLLIDQCTSAMFSLLHLTINESHLKLSQLTNITTKMQCLVSLDLRNNFIEGLQELIFGDLINLEHLNLSLNTFNRIDVQLFAECNSLRYLSLSRCEIFVIRPKALKYLSQLTDLVLSYNFFLDGFSCDLFKHLWRLKSLDLRSANLHEIPDDIFRNNHDLMNVQLHNNCIVELDMAVFRSVKNLKNLTFWNYTALKGLTSKKTLLEPKPMILT